jgi:hypothetical protein
MKKRVFGSSQGCHTNLKARVCCVLLGMAVLFIGSIASDRTRLSSSSPFKRSWLANSARPEPPWYIRSGQWHADMRSLIAALRFLAQSDRVEQTNLMTAKADKV